MVGLKFPGALQKAISSLVLEVIDNCLQIVWHYLEKASRSLHLKVWRGQVG